MKGRGEPVFGIACSGGGDSTALLLIAAKWAGKAGKELKVATVDHRLRPGSAAEAEQVAGAAEELGLPHRTLPWVEAPGQGNLQDAARQARRRLLADWARAEGLGAVLLGHTKDDQAETFLMRLARGSGVDGLAAMAETSRGEGIIWHRPLLQATRGALRAYLRREGATWSEDPSNEDPRFERVRIRQAMPLLDDLGLTMERLASTADRMAHARAALQEATHAAARNVLDPRPEGFVLLDPTALLDCQRDIAERLLAAALGWVTGAGYKPRLSQIQALMTALADADFAGQTLQGAQLLGFEGRVAICREPGRAGPAVPAGALWDGLWQTSGPAGTVVRALGEEGLSCLPDWRATGLPRPALAALPGFFRGDALIAAPFALPGKGCDARRVVGMSALLGPQERR